MDEIATLRELVDRGWLDAWLDGKCKLTVGYGIFRRPVLRIDLCEERHQNAERFADVYEWWPTVRRTSNTVCPAWHTIFVRWKEGVSDGRATE